MKLDGLIYSLSNEIKMLIAIFLFVINMGFVSALMMVENTTNFSAIGVEENYLGNEADEHAVEMKFQKSETQVMGIIHSHILTMALLFFIIGLLVSITKLSHTFKVFLIVEPFISLIITFGGIYLLWKGMVWLKYLIIISGTLMTISFFLSSIIIGFQLFQKKSFSLK